MSGEHPAVGMSHELRIQNLERERGAIAADISALRTELRIRLDRIEELLDERPSKVDLSIHPNRGRLSLSNVNSWVVSLIAVAIISVAIAVIVLARH